MWVGGRRVIAIDGKTVRGAKNTPGKAPHLAAALAHGTGAAGGQTAVPEKPNEIPVVRNLLTAFAGLAGALFTLDAMLVMLGYIRDGDDGPRSFCGPGF